MPNEITTAVVGAIVAALGFIGKQIFDSWTSWRSHGRERLARLANLQSLLLASRSVYVAQSVLRNSLYEEFCEKRPELRGMPFDDVLASGYEIADERQKRLHGLIRQYTISAMRPLNQEMREWLREDTYFKVARSSPELIELSQALQTLEAHLVLWLAKYDFWIPHAPDRALVFLADEGQQGVGFPIGIEVLVGRSLGAVG